jgi:hypothetical protein
MSNENKIGCFFLQLSIWENKPYQRYNSLATCAIDSFRKFHPDVQIFHITNDNIDEYLQLIGEDVDFYDQIGIVRYVLAEKVMRKLNIQKMIILGIDTITCSRLDEFLDDNTDILTALNYPCVESTAYWETPVAEFTDPAGNKFYDSMNVNADTVCFNNVEALKRVNELSIEHFSGFGEQGGLNEIIHMEKSFPFKIVDFPYHRSNVVYNARSKGVFGTGMNNEQTPQMHFYVKNNKLYTHDHKQIKVWHYIEGLSDQNEYEFKALLDKWKLKLFNEETKKFFKEHCSCGDFFERTYDIQKDWFGI